MAPILLLSNPEIDIKLPKLLPFTFNNEFKIFYLNDILKCVELVNSLPTDTKLPIYLICSQFESIENPLMDGLLALLVSLETFIKEFQFNWITLNDFYPLNQFLI